MDKNKQKQMMRMTVKGMDWMNMKSSKMNIILFGEEKDGDDDDDYGIGISYSGRRYQSPVNRVESSTFLSTPLNQILQLISWW